MNKPLLGLKVAMLVANGFSQDDMIAANKALVEAGANVRIVSPENGLVNGWDGSAWGHHFAVDTSLASALAADYSILVVPGGQRSIDKLNLTGHTKRFITSFMDADKPVVVMDDGLHIMILTDNIRGRTVSGPDTMSDVITQAGAEWSKKPVCVDGNLMSGAVNEMSRAGFAASMMDFLDRSAESTQAA